MYLLLRSDLYLLNALGGRHAVGVYTLAVTLAELARLGVDALWQVLTSRQFDADAEAALAFTATMVRRLLLLAVGSSLLIAVGTPLLLVPIYGAAYAGSVPLVLLLCPGVLVLGALRPISTYLCRMRVARVVVVPALLGFAANVGLNLLMIPRWGAGGCAVASSLAYAVVAAAQTGWFLHHTSLRVRELLPGRGELALCASLLRRRRRPTVHPDSPGAPPSPETRGAPHHPTGEHPAPPARDTTAEIDA